MSAVGLSMALGAFLAGVLLADSEYRHELEADIEPFKGLLLGLFFIAVGMSVNLGLRRRRSPLLVVGLVLGPDGAQGAGRSSASGGMGARAQRAGAEHGAASSPRAASSPSCCSGSRWAPGDGPARWRTCWWWW